LSLENTTYGGRHFGNAVGRLYSGTELDGLIESPGYPFDYDSGWLQAEAGTNYAITVEAETLAGDDFKLSMNYFPNPTNDFFTNRVVLTGSNVSARGSAFFATREENEPGSGRGVWYSWQPEFNGTATIELHYGTVLDIYTGETVSGLFRVGGISSHFATSVSVPVVAGTDYKFRVSLSHSVIVSGPFGFSLTITNVPSVPLLSSPATGRIEIRSLQIILPRGRTSVIETSTNLADWQPWRTNVTASMLAVPVGDEPQRFFRVRPE
jgi:hypothetical protein